MTDTKKGTLSLSGSVGLKKTSDKSDVRVRQSFSHGKSKVVAVEVKKKRAPLSMKNRGGTQSGSSDLNGDAMKKRIQLVQNAMRLEKEQAELRAKKDLEEKRQKEIDEARLANEKAANVSLEKDSFEEVVSPAIAEDVANIPAPINQHPSHDYDNKRQYSRKSKTVDEEEVKVNSTIKKAPAVKKDIKELRGKYSGTSGRVSIYNAFDEGGRTRSLSSIKRARQKNKAAAADQESKAIIKEVIIPETISIQELSSRMAIRSGDVIKKLMTMGMMVTANQSIDADTAELIVMEFGHTVKRVSESDVEIGLKTEDVAENLMHRPPVVTIMGHVDHGKTSLLDALRQTDVALKETGGITQKIGAYQVTIKDGRKITFVDTPGHAAFTEMRSRGANITDIVILVVAADDSVKDQTIEAINHARAAGVPVIVAINKIDKPGANAENVRNDLLQHEVIVEKFGGDIMDIEISAKNKVNLDKLEELILFQAEIMDLKANPHRNAEGVVLESKVEKGHGPVASVLITKGTLKVGDIFVSGSVSGRVRAIKNDKKENLDCLLPGAPGEIIGFNGNTVPGDDFIVVKDDSKAREIAGYRERKKREQEFVVSSKHTMEQMFNKIADGEKLQNLSIIIKADLQGSSEAISSSLNKLSTEEVAVKIIHSAIGEITESDVSLASASNAIILSFNVRSNAQARDQIARDKIEVRYYSIIYDLIDDVKAMMSGLLSPDIKENYLGRAEVRKTFDISKIGRIAGCMVIDGVIKRNSKARLIRNGIVIYTCDIKNLKTNKDQSKEVRNGFECGISLENYNDIHLNDIIECFELKEVARKL